MGLLSLLALACAPEGALTGVLLDARTGTPIAGAHVSLSPSGTPSDCASASVPTDPDGRFSLGGACNGPYSVSPAAPYALLEPVTAQAGQAVELRAWVLPPADGVWMLHEGRLLDVPSNTTLDTLPLPDDPTVTVRLPTEIPTHLPHLVGTDVLVLRGAFTRDSRIEPLVPSPARTLGPAEAPVPMAPWSYVGVRFDAAGSASPATVTPAPASLHEAEVAGQLVRTIGADALPAGAYALTYGAARAVLFAAGTAAPSSAPGATPPVAEAD